jgi:hypothetical protein
MRRPPETRLVDQGPPRAGEVRYKTAAAVPEVIDDGYLTGAWWTLVH